MTRYRPKHGTGGLDVKIASGGWLGSFPGRGAVVARLNAVIDEFLEWRDNLIDSVRPLQGDGTGSRLAATFYLNGRLVGSVSYHGTREQVTARVIEHWTENAYTCWDFRFSLGETIIDGSPIDIR